MSIIHVTLSFLFLFIFHFQDVSSAPTRHLCRSEQRDALLEFKTELEVGNPSSSCISGQPKMKSWANNIDCCYWDGITCDAKSGEVVELNLTFSCLHGQFHSNSNLFMVQSLRSLDLSNNDLSDQIPWSIGNFSHLTTLDLSRNYFSGWIPSSIENFSLLTNLSLYDNNLDGEIPSSLGNLYHLTTVDLSGNYFIGWIPSSIGNLSHLTSLSLHDNNLVGEIPSSFGKFSYLTTIDLSENYLSGRIPYSIGNFSHLTYLNIYDNYFVGEIPYSFASLNNLAFLDVKSNKISGSFPRVLLNLTKLSILSLSNNQLTGMLPSSLFTIPSLNSISLENNQLSGSLEFGNISLSSKLIKLRLGYNNFIGPIPVSISKLVNLTTLDLSHFNTQSSLDFSIFSNLKSLKYLSLSHLNTTTTIDLNVVLSCFKSLDTLDLSDNHLSVTNMTSVSDPHSQMIRVLYLSGCGITEFPELLRTEHKMEVLNISNNKIKGEVSAWLWTLPNPEHVDLSNNTFTSYERSTKHGLSTVMKPSMRYLYGSNNNFSGEIPSFICVLCSLVVLDLSYNNFNGSIPNCMGNLKNTLRLLDVGHNKLVGKLPRSLIHLSTLEVLNVESNIINDTFPYWLSSLPDLYVLVLSSNAFHGPIFFSGSNLRSLNAGHNELVGKLPRSLSNCSFLEVLNVENNKINDTFPFWLESLQRLQVLVLHHNEFHGSLQYHPKVASRFPQLRIIGISYNSFTGTLPSNFFNWSAMFSEGERSELTYIGDNYYYRDSLVLINKGVELKYTRILTLLIAIDISRNKLQGEIPKTIGLLKNLVVLNLSSNGFSGNIPSSLANLTVLESLDLSHNKLSGQIPPAMGDLTSLSNVMVSHNQLVGLIPQGIQFQTQGASSFEDNLGLCGPPLSKKCGDIDIAKSQEPESKEEEEEEEVLSWTAAVIGLAPGVIFGLMIGHIVITKKPQWLMKISGVMSLTHRFVTKRCI